MKVSTMLAPSFPGLNSVLNSKSKYSLQAAPGMNKLHHQITYVTEPKNTICSVFTSMFTTIQTIQKESTNGKVPSGITS